MVVTLNTCCGRYDLRTGCVIIAALWLVFSLLAIVGAPLMMRSLEKDMNDVYQHFNSTWNPEKQKMYDITLAGGTVYSILVVYSLYRYLRGETVPTNPSRAV